MTWSPRPLFAFVLLAAAACSGSDGAAATTDDTSGTTGGVAEPLTYYEDVMPLFVDNCVGCHTDKGIAPFAVDNYEDAKAWGGAIAAAVEARTMPPSPANVSGVCNTFKDARWLTDDEIAMVRQWVDEGAHEGDPNTVIPKPPETATLGGSNIMEIATPMYTPTPKGGATAKFDDYWCFPLEFGHETAKFLQGYEVLPGNDAIVHHAVGFKVDPSRTLSGSLTNQTVMDLLDNQSPEIPGWPCFGAAGENVLPEGTPVTWAPGGGANNFPEGTGIRFEPGDIIVLQMHYNLANGGGDDSTGVRLSWTDEVEREAYQVLQDRFLNTAFGGNPVTLEENREAVTWSWADTLYNFIPSNGEQMEILAIMPHMHERGQRMQVNYTIDGEQHCGLYVDRWDFNWQTAYFYEEPFLVHPTDKVEVTCEWNTMGADGPVGPGFGTGSEMCLIGMYVAETKPTRQ